MAVEVTRAITRTSINNIFQQNALAPLVPPVQGAHQFSVISAVQCAKMRISWGNTSERIIRIHREDIPDNINTNSWVAALSNRINSCIHHRRSLASNSNLVTTTAVVRRRKRT